MDNKTNFNIFIERKFTLVVTILGCFFFLFAILTLLKESSVFLSITFIIIGIYLVFSVIGIQINAKERKFKYYTKQFFIKIGKWQWLEDYPDVCVLLVNQKQTLYSMSNSSFTSKSIVYKVFLLNEWHREKFFIKVFKTEEKAILYAKDFAGRTGTNYTQFSPEISAATLSRRR